MPVDVTMDEAGRGLCRITIEQDGIAVVVSGVGVTREGAVDEACARMRQLIELASDVVNAMEEF